MKKLYTVLAITLLTIPVSAFAATRTVTLDVPTMTCPVCPITVRKALRAVPGVKKVDVQYAKREAIVTYDDATTNIAALTKATADAGYPSKPDGKGK
ncbi:MAG: mercury resistance system periplasmic binding protein MerP [Acidobacteriota bacterium]|jgi:mercuric ion binding protein